MERKIPPEAFDVYFELGPGRSYQAVADHFGVSKQAITRRAVDEDWQGRLAKIEAEARKKRDAKLVESAEHVGEADVRQPGDIDRGEYFLGGDGRGDAVF